MQTSVAEFVNKIETQNVPWLPYGLVEGCKFRILKVDEASNYEEDGTSYTFGMRFFKAPERITPEELAELDLEALLDFDA